MRNIKYLKTEILDLSLYYFKGAICIYVYMYICIPYSLVHKPKLYIRHPRDDISSSKKIYFYHCNENLFSYTKAA